ncbi:autotransporter outer membrane beta-barrel domain-containing protein [Luteolibacter marinus]|uniref:autotransporter outer membrane beta-barrel domain-containing protein n=1 Tax=Luteolibacter marinus TaxID=2776705 RepID=UPI001865C614|nr:hypothetical protein [Luteolibacter marinus]
MNHRSIPHLSLLGLIFIPLDLATADSIDSDASGNWNDTASWSTGVVPQTGVGDTANILTGHTILYTDSAPFAGLDQSNDFGVGNGNSVNINGGVLSQAQDGWWVRIGHKGAGTLNINDGRFHVTNGTGGGTNLQVGVEAGGNGTINVGDGTGEFGSAVLNLRDRIDGSPNGGAFTMNLAYTAGTVGTVTINAEGILEGDQKTWNGTTVAQNPHIRIGQSTSDLQSVLTVNPGGQFNARGNVEIGAGNGAKGLLHLTGTDSHMDMTDGELTVGFTGTGVMTVEEGAIFSRTNTTEARSDLFIGRNGTGNGTLTIASGGEFRRGAGGNVGDMRIGYDGTGVLNVETGGLYYNESGNWDWLGQNGAASSGTVNVNGGTYQIASGANLVIGGNGTGTFNHNSGSTNVSGIRAGVNSGTGLITIADGTFNVRAGIYLGGDGVASAGTGSGTVNQSGGTTTITGALVVGIAANHTGAYNLNGGTVTHSTSDTSVGESGSGTLTIADGASLSETTTGQFFVGRNEGSSGILMVNGTLTKSGSTNAIRVGNGDPNGVDNTTATGLLGGTGSLSSDAGVRIGSHGTLTGGSTDATGELDITGDLVFSASGSYSCDVDGAAADRVNVDGNLDITGATLAFDEISAPSGESYVIASYTGTLTGSFAASGTPAGYEVQYDGDAKQILLVQATPSTSFADWAGNNGLSGDPADDFDDDGLSDAVEFVLGTDPKASNGSATMVSAPGTDLVFTFNRDHDSLTPDVSVDIEVGTNLVDWPDVYHVGPVGGPSATEVETVDNGDHDTITLTVPRDSDAAKFARLRVTVTP